MAKVFINYRRSISAEFCRWLMDQLEHEFGSGEVFLDEASLPLGGEWRANLEQALEECAIMLSAIGPGWGAVRDEQGRRRLDLPDDYVRGELLTAQARGVLVIPLLHGDAVIDEVYDGPEALHWLGGLQGLSFAVGASEDAVERTLAHLITALVQKDPRLQPFFSPERLKQIRDIAVGVAVGGGAVGLLTRKSASRPAPSAPRRALEVFRDAGVPGVQPPPEMVVIPAGRFVMGSPEDEPGRRDNEGPQREVRIERDFALGRYAVTFDEYDAFCAATARERPDDQGRGRGRRPVINVSHEDAVAYCRWLSEFYEAPYRLPSEAEWEYACRAGTATAYAFGPEISAGQAQFETRGTAPVGSFAPNGWGLCDMHGNVSEWCEDHWHRNYDGAPGNGAAWLDADASRAADRVVRGGSWDDAARGVRSAYRLRLDPQFRDFRLGFRCARGQDQES